MTANNLNGAARGTEGDRFVLTQLGSRCWLVACNGKLIKGAVMSSLRSATEYAAALAVGSGRARFSIDVLPSIH